MAGEQRAGGDRKVLHAGPAAETGSAFQAAAVVSVNTAAVRADRLPVSIRPANAPEGHLGFRVFHLEDTGEGKGLGSAGKEEMFGHLDTYRLWKLS